MKNIETSFKEEVVIDLTPFLQPDMDFQLQFSFEGAYYFWIIDDVEIYEFDEDGVAYWFDDEEQVWYYFDEEYYDWIECEYED